MVSGTFFVSQIEEELRERNLMNYRFGVEQHMNQCLAVLNAYAVTHPYVHECKQACESVACKKLSVMDGIWKIAFRHCAAHVTVGFYSS